MTSFDHLALTGNAHYLVQHFGNPDTTLVAGEHYLSVTYTRDLTGVRYPDLLIAFNADPAAYRRSNATSSRSRASRRTSFWKSLPPAQEPRM